MPNASERLLWMRNPHSYIREVVLAGQERTIWDRGVLHRMGIDPQQHADFYYPPGVPFETAAIGDQGMAVMDRDHGFEAPKAVYPVWEYGQNSIDYLEHLMSENRAVDLRDRALTAQCPPDETPVEGQAHVVAVIRPPVVTTGVGIKFLALLDDLQGDYPDCTLHVHGLYAYRTMFGKSFRSLDVDARMHASKGKVMLPNGRVVAREEVVGYSAWIQLLGFSLKDLDDPKVRCIYSIKAAQWAMNHWNDDGLTPGPRVSAPLGVSGLSAAVNGRPHAPRRLARRRIAASRKRPPGQVLPGDKLYCGACSFEKSCRSYREGSVCSVSGTDASDLAKLFNTRDSTRIIEGLGRLIEGNLERLDEGREAEVARGELDPHVTALTDKVFKHGTTLAKLVDPALRSAAVAINLNGAGPMPAVEGATPQQLASRAVQALEQGGVPRDQITPEMVHKVMESDGNQTDRDLIIAAEAARYALPDGIIDVEVNDTDEVQAP